MNTPTAPSPTPADEAGLRQALSAWMDGAPLPPEVPEQALLDWLLADPTASAAWQQWHGVGEAVRQGQAAAPAGARAEADAGWMAQLQQRLAAASVASMTADVLAPPPVATCAVPADLPLHRPQPVAAPHGTAANAAVWRWKAAAGFASVAAAGLLGWNLLLLQPGGEAMPASGPALLAAGTVQPAPAAALVDTGATPVDDAHLNTLLLAHAQLAGEDMPPFADDGAY